MKLTRKSSQLLISSSGVKLIRKICLIPKAFFLARMIASELTYFLNKIAGGLFYLNQTWIQTRGYKIRRRLFLLFLSAFSDFKDSKPFNSSLIFSRI